VAQQFHGLRYVQVREGLARHDESPIATAKGLRDKCPEPLGLSRGCRPGQRTSAAPVSACPGLGCSAHDRRVAHVMRVQLALISWMLFAATRVQKDW